MSYRDPKFENPLLTGERPEKQPLRFYGLSRMVAEDTQKRIKYAFDKWSADEQEVFFELLSHFKEDFLMIATHMNRTFPKRCFPQSFCRYTYLQLVPDTPITKHESMLQNISIRYVNNDMYRNIGNKVMYSFKGCHSDILKRKFYNYLREVIRSINIYYADYQTQHFYDARFSRFPQTFLNLIFFLNKIELQKIESEDIIFPQMCKSSKTLVKLVQIWIEKDMMNINVPFDVFFSKNFIKKVPNMSPMQFMEMIEPLLTLDTIFRVTFNFQPYDKNNFEQIQYKPVVELDQNEVSPRKQLKIGYSFLFKQKRNQKNSLEIKYYPHLSQDQMRYLLNSSTMDIILYYMSYFHADNKKKMGHVKINQ